jgi:hypothetical protein
MTTGITPTATVSTVGTIISHWVTFFKAHEKLLFVVIASLVLVHFGDKVYDAYGKHLTVQQSAINAQIVTVEKSNADLATQIAALKTSFDAQAIISQARIVADQKKITVAQQADAVLPMPELSKHWEDLLVLPPNSITPQPNGTVAVTTDAAHTTVSELEKISPMTDELINTTNQLTACNVIRNQQGLLITGLNTDVADQKKGRLEDAKIAKHDIRHAYFKGLKHGTILGAAAMLAILHL